MNNLEKTLRIGEVVILDNDNFCLINESDDFRQVECSFRNEVRNTWANGFKIEFNGGLFSFKTFRAFEKKLNQLIKDCNLELTINLE